jgi:tetratricopeptide (TPR) repeat protein
LLRARIQLNLAYTLSKIVEHETGAAIFEIKDTSETDQTRREQGAPIDWLIRQQQFASAMTLLNAREMGLSQLEQAMEAIQDAKTYLTLADALPLWIDARRLLALVLWQRSKLDGERAHVDAALTAAVEALSHVSRQEDPLSWAELHNILGLIKYRIGQMTGDLRSFEDAASEFRLALEERTRERVPFLYAATQTGLGGVLTSLGEREEGLGTLRLARVAFQSAMDAVQDRGLPRFVELVRNGAQTAEAVIASRADAGDR